MESIDKIESMLNGHGYFRCERNHARISKEICVKRQRENKVAKMYGYRYPDCMKCEQGEENMKGFESGGVEERKRGRVDGRGKEAMPLCKCGQEAVLPHNARVPQWCSKCWGDRQRKPRGKYKKRAGRETEETTNSFLDKLGEKYRNNPEGAKDNSRLKSAVEKELKDIRVWQVSVEDKIIVDFGGYPELLKDVKAEANREVRSTEQQIIYLLKRWKRVFVDSGDSDEIK